MRSQLFFGGTWSRVLFTLKVSLFASNHDTTLDNSVLRIWIGSSLQLLWTHTVVSSAKSTKRQDSTGINYVIDVDQKQMWSKNNCSLENIYIFKFNGCECIWFQKTKCLGAELFIPELFIYQSSLYIPELYIYQSSLYIPELFIHCNTLKLWRYLLSFVNKISWFTQSNALLRSTMAPIETFLLSQHFIISSVNFKRACSVLAPDLKPNCDDESMLLTDKYSKSFM